jgi:hypothetical protein
MDTVDWVTAVEVLAAPGGRDVNKWDCVDLIGSADAATEPAIVRRKYRARKGKGRVSLNLPQKLYLQLHRARSKFVHGDAISPSLLVFGANGSSLVSLASTVYRTALIAYLERHWPLRENVQGLSLEMVSEFAYSEHLLAAV